MPNIASFFHEKDTYIMNNKYIIVTNVLIFIYKSPNKKTPKKDAKEKTQKKRC